MVAFMPKKVAVLGAGAMGKQIACDLGDKGFTVYLFDLPGVAQKSLASAVKDGLCTYTGLRRVMPVDNVPANHHLLSEVDWIVEAVYENEKVKDEINQTIAAYQKPGCVVTTNTSGIGINSMAQKQSEKFRKNYGLSHFFNPVKFLGLLEICPVEGTDPEIFQSFYRFAEIMLGKTVIKVKDTPNFVGNRIGGLCLFLPFRLNTQGLNILDIDRTCLCTVGWEPLKTWDIVGLQLAEPVSANVYNRAPNDPRREWWNPQFPQVRTLLDKGFIGRKGKSESGFLGMINRKKMMFDFDKREYIPAQLSKHPSLELAMDDKTKELKKMEILLSPEYTDPAALFARDFFFTTLAYSLRMVGEICDRIIDIDIALKHGFNWPMGIFERAQYLGLSRCVKGMEEAGCSDMLPDWFTTLVKKGDSLYGQPKNTFYSYAQKNMEEMPVVEGGIYPEIIKKSGDKKIFANEDAMVLDISDSKGPSSLLVVTSKGNSINMGVIEAGHKAIDWAEKHQAAVVIGNTGPHFGLGANLSLLFKASETGDKETIRNLVKNGQEFMQRLEYSDCPTVAAIQGYCLGGSSELALACNRRVANANLNMGQTELNVGVIPAWGGLMRMARHLEKGLLHYYLWGSDMTVTVLVEHLMDVWNRYSWIKTSRDAYHAREMGFLNEQDVIVPAQGLGQPYVLKRAKEVAQSMLMQGFTPPSPFIFNLPGKEGFLKFKTIAELGCMQDWYPVMHPAHNTRCAILAARVLCGGEDNKLGKPVTEQQLLDLEYEGFMEITMASEVRDYIKKILKK